MEGMYDKQNYHAIVPFADIVRVELDKIGKEGENKIKIRMMHRTMSPWNRRREKVKSIEHILKSVWK